MGLSGEEVVTRFSRRVSESKNNFQPKRVKEEALNAVVSRLSSEGANTSELERQSRVLAWLGDRV